MVPNYAEEKEQASPYRLLNRPSIHILLIALIGLIAYSNTFHVPFLFDDELSIVNNNVIKDLGTFLSGPGWEYNPRRFIGYLSLALNYKFGGTDVAGYHVFNLAVHLLSGALVYLLCRLTLLTPYFKDRESGESGAGSDARFLAFIPLFAGLLFVAHPIQTQAVTYIVQRLASLAAFFFLLSMVCYVAARLAGAQGRALKMLLLYLAAVAAAALAMKTKEITFTLPMVIFLYELMFFRLTLRKWLILLVPLLVLLLVVPVSIIGAGKPIGELLSDVSEKTRVQTNIPRLDYLLTQFRVIVTYLRLLLFPVNQNIDYDYPVYRSLFTPSVLFSFLLLLALVGCAAWLWRKTRANNPSVADPKLRLISFGILWFFITISVESSLIPIEDLIFEHRVYLPSAGLFLAVATLAVSLSRRVSPRVVAGAAAAIILVLTGATFARNLTWQSEVKLWADAAAKSPAKPRPHYNLALALSKENAVDGALREADIAAKLAPGEPKVLNLLGCLYGRTERYQEASAAFTQSIAVDPEAAEPHTNLGDVFRRQGVLDKAHEQYLISLKLSPTNPAIYDKIGTTYRLQGNIQRAIEFCESAVSLDPSRPEYRLNLELARSLSAATPVQPIQRRRS